MEFKAGDRVSWRVRHPSSTRLKPAFNTFYGTVIRLENANSHGCRSCRCGDLEAVVKTDRYPDSSARYRIKDLSPVPSEKHCLECSRCGPIPEDEWELHERHSE